MTTSSFGSPTSADFDAWNDKKKHIHFQRRRPPTFRQGEVWWCDLGVNVGNEQNGDCISRDGQPPSFRRPVLVLKKLDDQNCVALPLTTQPHAGRWYYPLTVKGRDNWVLLVHIRMVSAKRLTKMIVELPESEFVQIKQACGVALGI